MKILPMATAALVGALGAVATAFLVPHQEVSTAPPPVRIPVVVYEPKWNCPTCTPEEKYVLKELQEHTKITDRNALATILGNIKQESNFTANVCEGGARVSYSECTRGGYGLIQWTSLGRYNNLGKFCDKFSCDPSTLEGQTRYCLLYTSPSPRDYAASRMPSSA